MANDGLESYFRAHQVSAQWLMVSRALAAEVSTQAGKEELQQLFSKIGARMATEAEPSFVEAQTLTRLEECLNAFWSSMDWGWVELKESAGFVDIAHGAAPLAMAFGENAIEWSVGLLEGFYERVFHGLGASSGMSVRAVGMSANGMNIHLKFGR